MEIAFKDEIIYQIYPMSFCDSNGDGIGDLRGVILKLDYLQNLGITCIWISPFFKSPRDDNGYDISDYRDVDPVFGTLDDFKDLMKEAHRRKIKVLMDLVVNHTSDEHPWFIESKKSRDNPCRDYYIWRDGKNNGEPPSDWGSHFSGSAWEWDETTGQYYLHLFSKKQPDLNWENPRVRGEIFDMMEFWSGLGIDGYRIDTACMYSKNMQFPDTGEKYKVACEYFNDGPRMHEYFREMHEKVFEKYGQLSVGEANGLTPYKASLYTREDRKELSMILQFGHVMLNRKTHKWANDPVTPFDFKKALLGWYEPIYAYSGHLGNYLSNHDQPRQVSKFGDDKKFWKESAVMLAMLNFTLPGIPFVYQGEEIGMTNCFFEQDEYRDVEILNFFRQCESEGKNLNQYMDGVVFNNRDNARTPMQWSSGINAGFSSAHPWIKVNPNYTRINVEQQMHDGDSILAAYKKLISLRKNHRVLVNGNFSVLDREHPELLLFSRENQEEIFLVILNLSRRSITYAMDLSIDIDSFKVLFANFTLGRPFGNLIVPPFGGCILRRGSESAV